MTDWLLLLCGIDIVLFDCWLLLLDIVIDLVVLTWLVIGCYCYYCDWPSYWRFICCWLVLTPVFDGHCYCWWQYLLTVGYGLDWLTGLTVIDPIVGIDYWHWDVSQLMIVVVIIIVVGHCGQTLLNWLTDPIVDWRWPGCGIDWPNIVIVVLFGGIGHCYLFVLMTLLFIVGWLLLTVVDW